MYNLFEKNTFKFILISNVISKVRIFIFYFVDKIKNKRTTMAFEKSSLVIQAYNNYDKKKILIQSSII